MILDAKKYSVSINTVWEHLLYKKWYSLTHPYKKKYMKALDSTFTSVTLYM